MNKGVRIFFGLFLSIIGLLAFLFTLIGVFLVEEIIVIIIYLSILGTGVSIFITGVLLFQNKLTLRKFLASEALFVSLIIFGIFMVISINFQHQMTHRLLWIYLLPLPAFALFSWGSFYLYFTSRELKGLKTHKSYIWIYIGILGEAITLCIYSFSGMVAKNNLLMYITPVTTITTIVILIAAGILWAVISMKRRRM